MCILITEFNFYLYTENLNYVIHNHYYPNFPVNKWKYTDYVGIIATVKYYYELWLKNPQY